MPAVTAGGRGRSPAPSAAAAYRSATVMVDDHDLIAVAVAPEEA